MTTLVAKVDGRNVPLTVGYHKVTVDIRDQIARIVVEESFVNHTAERLEGVFHFPLPADASISGFGMWIGGQYIEADVVEKQRAPSEAPPLGEGRRCSTAVWGDWRGCDAVQSRCSASRGRWRRRFGYNRAGRLTVRREARSVPLLIRAACRRSRAAMRRVAAIVAALAATGLISAGAAAQAGDTSVSFQRDIAPLLRSRCQAMDRKPRGRAECRRARRATRRHCQIDEGARIGLEGWLPT